MICLHALFLFVRQANASSVGGLVVVDWPVDDGGVPLLSLAITIDLLGYVGSDPSAGGGCTGDGNGYAVDLPPSASRAQPVVVAITGLTGNCRCDGVLSLCTPRRVLSPAQPSLLSVVMALCTFWIPGSV